MAELMQYFSTAVVAGLARTAVSSKKLLYVHTLSEAEKMKDQLTTTCNCCSTALMLSQGVSVNVRVPTVPPAAP